MCLSTPVNPVAIVSLEHSCPTGLRSCWIDLHIQDACGCVRRITTRLYKTHLATGDHWLMSKILPQTVCAQHVDMVAKEWATTHQASPGSTPEAVTQSSS